MRKVGAHVSIAGGLVKGLERAKQLGCNCLQIFSGSPRVWAKADLEEREIEKFNRQQKELELSPVITHAIYLVNLASDKESLVEKSIKTLKYDLRLDAAIGGGGVVVHLGSHQGRGWEASRDQLVVSLQQILQDTPEKSQFLIENSAGQKGKIGSDLEEIHWLLSQVDSKRLGWCFDTCHAFTAGYSLGEKQQQSPQKKRNQRQGTLVEEIERLELWSSLKCVHVNDSKGSFGSGQDKHANLGEGELEPEDLRYLLNRPQLEKVPLILEVPGQEGFPDRENVERLKDLLE